jgi:restriction endonuclease S subunit
MTSGWARASLGDVVEILDSQRKPITKRDRLPGGIPYYGATGILDFVDGYIFNEPLVLVGEDGAKWDKGDQTAFPIEGKSWVNNHAHVLRPMRELVLDAWIIYCLNGMDLTAFTSGLTVPKLNQASLKSIPIPLPSLDEQRRIVKVLDEAQQLITEGRASATKIEAACGELTRSALRTQLASFPSRTRVESLASLIDGGVIYLNRGKIISKRDLNASPGDYPVYSSASANNGQFGRYGEFMFDEEAITWSIDGGGTFFHRPRHKFSVTNVGGILRIADLGTVNYRYLYLVLNEHQQTINFDWVRKAHPSVIRGLYNHIPIPPLETQDQIVARMDEIQASVQNLSDTATSRKHLFAHLQSSSLESLIEVV